MSADVSEAVERLAKLLCTQRGYDPDEHVIGGQATGFEDFGPRWKAARNGHWHGFHDYEQDARDILAALQEGSGALPASPSGGQGSSAAPIPTEPLEPLLAELERLARAWSVPFTGRKHDLKCWPEPFAAIRAGLKTWDLRRNDRDYRVGDLLWQREWEPNTDAYTGEATGNLVTWMLEGPAFGLPEGYCIMSLDVHPATVLKLIAAARAREVGMQAFAEGRNAPQPSPEPRDREEG